MSPRSSLDLGDTPRHKGTDNLQEKRIIDSAAALEKYYKASNKASEFEKELIANLQKLPFDEKIALQYVYVFNINRIPEERKNGIARFLGIKRKDVPPIIRRGKAHLAEILRAQGIEIED